MHEHIQTLYKEKCAYYITVSQCVYLHKHHPRAKSSRFVGVASPFSLLLGKLKTRCADRLVFVLPGKTQGFTIRSTVKRKEKKT